MAFCLPVLPPQEQAQQGAGQRRDEGVGRGVEARGAFGAGSGPEGLGLELVASEGDAPVGVDDGGDAGVGAADEPALLLDAAQARQVEVLAGSRGGAEPAVVADVEEEVGALGRAGLGQPGEDALVADEGAHDEPARAQGGGASSRGVGAHFLQEGR